MKKIIVIAVILSVIILFFWYSFSGFKMQRILSVKSEYEQMLKDEVLRNYDIYMELVGTNNISGLGIGRENDGSFRAHYFKDNEKIEVDIADVFSPEVCDFLSWRLESSEIKQSVRGIRFYSIWCREEGVEFVVKIKEPPEIILFYSPSKSKYKYGRPAAYVWTTQIDEYWSITYAFYNMA